MNGKTLALNIIKLVTDEKGDVEENLDLIIKLMDDHMKTMEPLIKLLDLIIEELKKSD